MRDITNPCSADQAFGEPSQVLELADVPGPSGPALGEVLVGVVYETTHLNKIEYPAMINRQAT